MKVSRLPDATAWRVTLMVLAAPAALLAGPEPTVSAPDKSAYTLFNPTPRTQLRDMNTDRPDQTEGPYTVDAGHVQLEMDLVNFEFYAVVGTAPGFAWQGQADVGITYAVTDDLQFDCGCNFGLTKSAPDFQPFAGISIRF